MIPSGALYGHIGGGGTGFSDAAFFDPNTHYILVDFTNIDQNIYPSVINYFDMLLGEPLYPVKKITQNKYLTR